MQTWLLRKISPALGGTRPRFFEAIAAASNRSPMRRGLKCQAPGAPGEGRTIASNRSPMRRGLKSFTEQRTGRAADASNRSPMRRGLKCPSRTVARGPVRASNRSPMRRGLKSGSHTLTLYHFQASNRSPMRRGLKWSSPKTARTINKRTPLPDRSRVHSNDRHCIRTKYKTKEGPSRLAPDPSSHGNGCYFLIPAFFARAADPYRLAKHFRHRRSRRLMKLGARSSLPQ